MIEIYYCSPNITRVEGTEENVIHSHPHCCRATGNFRADMIKGLDSFLIIRIDTENTFACIDLYFKTQDALLEFLLKM